MNCAIAMAVVAPVTIKMVSMCVPIIFGLKRSIRAETPLIVLGVYILLFSVRNGGYSRGSWWMADSRFTTGFRFGASVRSE